MRKSWNLVGAAAVVAAGLIASSCSSTSGDKPTVTATRTPSGTATNTPIPPTATRTNTFTFTNTNTPLPTATGVYLYIYGGDGGASAVSGVYSALVTSGGGLGSWVSTTSMPAATTNLAYCFNGSYLFAIGGNMGSASINNVRYAPMGGGVVGPWISASPVPTAVQLSGAAIANGRMWTWGGSTGAGGLQVYSAPLVGNLPTTWSLAGSVPTPVSAFYWGSDGSYLYHATGSEPGTGSPVYAESWGVLANGSGTIGSWTMGAPVPTPVCYGQGWVANGQIFVVSGSETTWGASSVTDVWSAPASGGTIGSWVANAQLPVGLAQPAIIDVGGYLYVVGGIQNDQSTGNTCYSGQITGSGVTSWTTLANLPWNIEMCGIAYR